MPRKIRQLKADLKRAGFILRPERGKGSHSAWRHPAVPGTLVVLSGNDGDDARSYQERDVQAALEKVKLAGV
jgi:predicted RNA binding protein YcfA (HicA-like mRNA interferase family)